MYRLRGGMEGGCYQGKRIRNTEQDRMKRKRCKWQMQANTRQDARQTKAEEMIGEGGEGDRWREGEVCL